MVVQALGSSETTPEWNRLPSVDRHLYRCSDPQPCRFPFRCAASPDRSVQILSALYSLCVAWTGCGSPAPHAASSALAASGSCWRRWAAEWETVE